MSAKRFLVSTLGGIGLSLLVFKVGESGQIGWRVLPLLPGFVVAMFTPGFGVHGNMRAFNCLMLIANAVFYGFLVFACYPLFAPREK